MSPKFEMQQNQHFLTQMPVRRIVAPINSVNESNLQIIYQNKQVSYLLKENFEDYNTGYDQTPKDSRTPDLDRVIASSIPAKRPKTHK